MAWAAQTILFGVVILFIVHDADWGPMLVLVTTIIGAASLSAVLLAHRRAVDPSSARALSGSYRTRFFLQIAFAQAGSLVGLVGAFSVNGAAYWIPAAFTLAGFQVAAPTRNSLDREQAAITASGSALRLFEVLDTPTQ